MAAPKQQKAELIAIYRLEFYKKQNNWKLSADARKEKRIKNVLPTIAPVKNSKILNETYSIETNIDSGANELNDAFLKDDSGMDRLVADDYLSPDKDAPVSPLIQRNLHTQFLEPVNACQECHHHSKPQNPWADYVDEGWRNSDVVDKGSGDGNEFEMFDGWTDGMIWTNSANPWAGSTGEDVPLPETIQDVECPELRWATDNKIYHQLERLDQLTPWPDDQIRVPEIWGEDDVLVESLESFDEFMLGAHSVPHSSEVELRVTDAEKEGLNVSLSRMSGADLSAAVRRHTGSLRRLLREARQRRKYLSTFSLDMCAQDHFEVAPREIFSTEYSYESFPTRDISSTPMHPTSPLNPKSLTNLSKDKGDLSPLHSVNKLTPLSPANLYRHGFLAGSYRNKGPPSFIGRGRGRLPEDTESKM